MVQRLLIQPAERDGTLCVRVSVWVKNPRPFILVQQLTGSVKSCTSSWRKVHTHIHTHTCEHMTCPLSLFFSQKVISDL